MKGTNQYHVQRRIRGAQSQESKNGERERKPVPACREVAFFFTHASSFLFGSGTSGSFCKFNSFLFFLFFQFKFFIYLFVTYRCGELLLFLGDSDFFLLHSLVISYVCWSCKGIKFRRKKTRIPLNSHFFGGVYDYLVEYVPKPVEIVMLCRRV